METRGQEALRSVASIPSEGLSQDPPIRQPPTWGTPTLACCSGMRPAGGMLKIRLRGLRSPWYLSTALGTLVAL